MKTYDECLPCFERQTSEACALCGMDREATADVLDSVRRRMHAFPRSHSPVEMAVEIHQMVRAAADHRDPYKAIKEQSNRASREAMNVISGERWRNELWQIHPLLRPGCSVRHETM